MATLAGKINWLNDLRKILGIEIPVSRIVIDAQREGPVRIYVQGYFEEEKTEPFYKWISDCQKETVYVKDIEIDEKGNVKPIE